MMGFLGGILKTILSPVTKLIFRALYGVFIKGPLWVLNVETKALTYATGAQTDRLIFDTSLKDGTGKLNFFATTGVVHDLFMVMISIVGTLIAFTVGLVIVKTLYKGKINPIKKVIQFSMNSTLIFGIPLLFLTGLSLSGAFMSALDGKAVAMSSKDITGFKTETRKNSQKLLGGSWSSSAFNKTASMSGMYDDPIGTTSPSTGSSYNIDQVYDKLIIKDSKLNPFNPSDTIIALATKSRDDYKVMYDSLVKMVGGTSGSKNNPELLKSVKDSLADLNTVIAHLIPNEKDGVKSDKVQKLNKTLSAIQDNIKTWVQSSEELLSYKPSNPSMTLKYSYALENFKLAFDTIYGTGNYSKSPPTTLNNFKSFAYFASVLREGSYNHPNVGLTDLNKRLSVFEDSSIVISFYQMVTGNKDTNWNQSFNHMNNGGVMILIGFIVIIAAIVLLASIIIEAFIRIGVLAGLFIISPIMVGLSPIDDGARMKTWINVVFAQFISIFGVVIVLRLGGVLTGKFSDAIQTSKDFGGQDGFLFQSILTGLFAMAMIMAAKQSKAIFASLAGSNQGMLSAMQGFGSLKRIVSPISKGMGRVSGFGTKSSRSSGGGGSSSGGASGGALSNFKSNWGQRRQSLASAGRSASNGLTKASFGAVGTKGAKARRNASLSAKRAAKIKNQENKTAYIKDNKSVRKTRHDVKQNKIVEKHNRKNI